MEPVNPRSTAPQRGERFLPKRAPPFAAPMTAEDVNEFIAHSGDESSGSSDWNDVKEEAEEREEVGSFGIDVVHCTVSMPSSNPQAVRDAEVVKLPDPSRINFELTDPQSAGTEDENILKHNGTQQSGLSEHGLRISNSLSKIVPERHGRRLEEESPRIICGSEQVANIEPQDPLTDAQKKALQICETKRASVLASLGGSRTGSSSYSSSLRNDEYFVALPTNIRVMRPQISSELWAKRTNNRRVFSLSQYVREAAESGGSSLQTEATVLVGVIGSKTPPHRSRNNKIFSIWRLTDLMSVGTGAPNGHNISLFLFGSTHEKLWKESEGTVVAILKPKLLPPNERSNLTNTNGIGLSVTVDSAPFVLLLGMSLDFALCAATTKVGRPCGRIVNKNVCRYCDLHVRTTYYSASSVRPGFATTLISKSDCSDRCGSKRSFGNHSALALSGSASLLYHPNSMPINRSQDARSLNRLVVSYPSASNVVKAASASSAIARSTPSEWGVSFASSLTRPTRGSLNLLRYLESASFSHQTIPESSVKSKCLKKTIFQANSNKTFATFFAGVKHKTLAQKPQIGRGLGGDDNFIDLGPVSVRDSKTNANSMVPPPHDAARRRAEALVQIKGGIGSLHQSAQEQVRKRILDVVSQSIPKKTKLSPLAQVLDSASSMKTNEDSKQESSERTPKSSDTWKSEKRAELATLVSQGSRHADIVAVNETNAEQKLLSRLEARDSIERVLLNQHEQECQIVTCLRCQYRSLHASQICRKEGHKLEFSTGVKRFFACRKCKTRTTTLDRYPNFACINCGESLFEKSGAIAERKGPKLVGEKLLIRGFEEKYLSLYGQL